jgi:type I restriction enzyme S subunit
LSPEQIKSFRFALPGIEEQCAIVEWTSAVTIEINRVAMIAEREIALLREYRTRLIADVVTGKLDVREAAARLPDDVDEPEQFDEPELEGDVEDLGDGDTAEVPAEAEA